MREQSLGYKTLRNTEGPKRVMAIACSTETSLLLGLSEHPAMFLTVSARHSRSLKASKFLEAITAANKGTLRLRSLKDIVGADSESKHEVGGQH